MTDRLDETFNVDELLHPASAFGHPSEVGDDPDLTLNEKRAILASWASAIVATSICPHCGAEHAWRVEDARYVDTLPPDLSVSSDKLNRRTRFAFSAGE